MRGERTSAAKSAGQIRRPTGGEVRRGLTSARPGTVISLATSTHGRITALKGEQDDDGGKQQKYRLHDDLLSDQ